MPFDIETVSDNDGPDYEIWTCKDCNTQLILEGVGGAVACCPTCEERQAYQDWADNQMEADEAIEEEIE
jgi:hypothetical protein